MEAISSQEGGTATAEVVQTEGMKAEQDQEFKDFKGWAEAAKKIAGESKEGGENHGLIELISLAEQIKEIDLAIDGQETEIKENWEHKMQALEDRDLNYKKSQEYADLIGEQRRQRKGADERMKPFFKKIAELCRIFLGRIGFSQKYLNHEISKEFRKYLIGAIRNNMQTQIDHNNRLDHFKLTDGMIQRSLGEVLEREADGSLDRQIKQFDLAKAQVAEKRGEEVMISSGQERKQIMEIGVI